jgi:surface protein
MSVRTVSASPTTSNAGLNTKRLQATQPWVRNPSWPAISAVAGDNKLVGLYAVWPGDGVGNGGNFFAANCSGAYTINYGDGTTTNYGAATQANYEFNFNSASLAGTNAPVTLTDAGDLVTRTAHGYTSGMTVKFYNIVTTTGLSANTPYFVINATANTFQVSTTPAGSPVALTNNGSATLLPYKITVVTITPQAGQTLTSIDLGVKNSSVTLGVQVNTGALDIAVACSTLTALFIGSVGGVVQSSILEQVKVVEVGAMTLMSSMFLRCSALRNVQLPLNTAAVTSTSNMFEQCSSLTTVPLFNTAAVTNMAAMFNGCYSLTSVPLFNTAAVTNMSTMFTACSALQSVPLFNTAAVTNMSSMFNSCRMLTTVPLFNTAAAINMSSMFSGCLVLQSVPLFNTAAVTNMSTMFNGCTSLTSVPLFNTAAVTTIAQMFQSSVALQSVPAFNLNATTSSSSYLITFSGCPNITRIQATPFKFSFQVTGCKLSATALNEIYTNLPTVSGQTITVLNNYGITADNPAIATAKGWAVTG